MYMCIDYEEKLSLNFRQFEKVNGRENGRGVGKIWRATSENIGIGKEQINPWIDRKIALKNWLYIAKSEVVEMSEWLVWELYFCGKINLHNN